MHARLLFLLALALPALLVAQPPAAEPLDCYRSMMDRSPFALATEAPTVTPDQPGFAKDLVLTGVVRLTDGEHITIASRDQTQQFSLRTGETYNGITLVSVNWSNAAGKSRATLKKGIEYATIAFDEAVTTSSTTPAAKFTPPQARQNGKASPPSTVLRRAPTIHTPPTQPAKNTP